MIHQLFSIFDAKAQAYLPPFILPRQEMAERVFSDAVNSNDHQFGKHPEDYTLFLLGTFDDERAEYALQSTPQSLGLGIEYVQHKDVTQAMEGLSDAETIRTDQPTIGNGSPVQPSPTSDNSPE